MSNQFSIPTVGQLQGFVNDLNSSIASTVYSNFLNTAGTVLISASFNGQSLNGRSQFFPSTTQYATTNAGTIVLNPTSVKLLMQADPSLTNEQAWQEVMTHESGHEVYQVTDGSNYYTDFLGASATFDTKLSYSFNVEAEASIFS
jgi:hypothetical protein